MLNVKAHELNRRLFDLCYELGQLDLLAANALDSDAAAEFTAAVDAVKEAQARLASTDLVVDATRDRQDQSHAVEGDR
jgi:hypothetical protein